MLDRHEAKIDAAEGLVHTWHPRLTAVPIGCRVKILRAAVVVSLALVVGGCSADEPKPSTLPPVPAASASPPAPTVPAEAAADNAPGASAFARFYLDSANQAFAAGDADALRGYSSLDCGSCNNLIRAIEAPVDPKERVEGGDYEVLDVTSTPSSDGEMLSLVTYRLSEVRVYDESGALIETDPAKPSITASMSLRRAGDAWQVLSFTNVKP